jgi:hypothetical protein
MTVALKQLARKFHIRLAFYVAKANQIIFPFSVH